MAFINGQNLGSERPPAKVDWKTVFGMGHFRNDEGATIKSRFAVNGCVD